MPENIPPLDRIESNLKSAVAREGSRRRSRRWRYGTATAGALVAVLATALIVGGPDRSGRLSLDDAVAAVARAAFDSPVEQPGKTLHIKSQFTGVSGGFSLGVGSFLASKTYTRETWYDGGKKGWIRMVDHPMVFPTARDKEIYFKVTGSERIARRNSLGHVATCESVIAAQAPQSSPAASQLQLPRGTRIPKDPEKVYELLRDHQQGVYLGPGGKSQGIWMLIANSLQGGRIDLSPAQQAAVAGALAYLPGVSTLGRVDDPNGMPTIGFERTYGNRRARVFFDASTAMTTYMDETIISNQLSKLQKRQGDRPTIPVGTKMSVWELLKYEHLDAMPRLRPSSPYGWAKEVCPEVRHRLRAK